MEFYSIIIKEIVRQTRDCVQLILDVGAHKDQFHPFIAGQYLTFQSNVADQEIRRSYSICSSPNEQELSVAIKQIPEGLFSTFANNDLKAGDKILCAPPAGTFLKNHQILQGKNLLCIAAGSGITPMLSIMKYHLETNTENQCTLLYGNRSSKSIIFKEELDHLKSNFMNRFQQFHFFSREQGVSELFNGRLSFDKLSTLFGSVLNFESYDEFFLCGPEEMVLDMKTGLTKLSDPSHVHLELFFTNTDKTKKVKLQKTTAEKNILEIIHLGKTHLIELEEDFTNVLEEATAQGLDLPYACKGGVCCTCKAKVDEGTAKMFVNYALEPEEVDAGYVLTCQCYPTSSKLVINYDKAL